jgi:hypothetical protein
VTKNKNNSTASEEEEKPRKKKKPRARGKHCVAVKEAFGEIMATMAAAATTLGRLTTTQEAAALASLRSYPSSSPLLCAAFSHSKFAHGATTVIGPCWRGEQPGRKWDQVLRQSSRGSSRGGALLCMSSISLGTKETATSSDSLFSNYKPSTAFLFPGQVNKLQRMDASLWCAFGHENLDLERMMSKSDDGKNHLKSTVNL